jgi:hypothetical protein
MRLRNGTGVHLVHLSRRRMQEYRNMREFKKPYIDNSPLLPRTQRSFTYLSLILLALHVAA